MSTWASWTRRGERSSRRSTSEAVTGPEVAGVLGIDLWNDRTRLRAGTGTRVSVVPPGGDLFSELVVR